MNKEKLKRLSKITNKIERIDGWLNKTEVTIYMKSEKFTSTKVEYVETNLKEHNIYVDFSEITAVKTVIEQLFRNKLEALKKDLLVIAEEIAKEKD